MFENHWHGVHIKKSFLNSIFHTENHATFEGLWKPEVECSRAWPWTELPEIPAGIHFLHIYAQNRKHPE